MIRTQIYLTAAEKKALSAISREEAVPQSVLIREAIDQFIESKKQTSGNKQDALKAANGLWAKRTDLPDFTALRHEADRDFDDE